MLNLIKMNMSRLFMTKTIYVLLLITFVSFAGFSAVITDEGSEIERELIEQEMAEAEPGESFGMAIVPLNDIDQLLFEDVYEQLSVTGLMLILIGVSAVGYIDDERRHGFLKNLTLGKHEKKYVFLSKLAVVLLQAFILNCAALLGILVGLFLKDILLIGSAAYVLKLFVYNSLLDTAFAMAMMALYECVRRNVPILLVAVFCAFNAMTLICIMIEDRLAGVLPVNFGLSGLLIEYRVHMGCLEAPVSSLIVAIASIIIYSSIGSVIYAKRDVI